MHTRGRTAVLTFALLGALGGCTGQAADPPSTPATTAPTHRAQPPRSPSATPDPTPSGSFPLTVRTIAASGMSLERIPWMLYDGSGFAIGLGRGDVTQGPSTWAVYDTSGTSYGAVTNIPIEDGVCGPVLVESASDGPLLVWTVFDVTPAQGVELGGTTYSVVAYAGGGEQVWKTPVLEVPGTVQPSCSLDATSNGSALHTVNAGQNRSWTETWLDPATGAVRAGMPPGARTTGPYAAVWPADNGAVTLYDPTTGATVATVDRPTAEQLGNHTRWGMRSGHDDAWAGPVAVDNQAVLARTPDTANPVEEMYRLDLVTGNVLWSTAVPPSPAAGLNTETKVYSAIWYPGDHLVIADAKDSATSEGYSFAMDDRTGKVLWVVPSFKSCSVDAGKVLVITYTQWAVLNAADGTQLAFGSHDSGYCPPLTPDGALRVSYDYATDSAVIDDDLNPFD